MELRSSDVFTHPNVRLGTEGGLGHVGRALMFGDDLLSLRYVLAVPLSGLTLQDANEKKRDRDKPGV